MHLVYVFLSLSNLQRLPRPRAEDHGASGHLGQNLQQGDVSFPCNTVQVDNWLKHKMQIPSSLSNVSKARAVIFTVQHKKENLSY